MQERYSRKTEAADLQRAFTILDSKGDGKIDAAELGYLFKRLGHKFTKVQDVQCILERVALSVDGPLCTSQEDPTQSCIKGVAASLPELCKLWCRQR